MKVMQRWGDRYSLNEVVWVTQYDWRVYIFFDHCAQRYPRQSNAVQGIQGILLLLFVCVFYVLFIIRCNIAFVYLFFDHCAQTSISPSYFAKAVHPTSPRQSKASYCCCLCVFSTFCLSFVAILHSCTEATLTPIGKAKSLCWLALQNTSRGRYHCGMYWPPPPRGVPPRTHAQRRHFTPCAHPKTAPLSPPLEF